MNYHLQAALMVLVTAMPALAQGTLVRRSSEGKISFTAAAGIQFEGSRKVRLLTISNSSLSPAELKKIQKTETAQLGRLLLDDKARVVTVRRDGRPTELLVPETYNPTATIEPSSAAVTPAIEILEEAKAKRGTPVSPSEFVAWLPGSASDRSALEFVTDDVWFSRPEEQIAAMAGFAASFPTSPLKQDLRDNLVNRMETALTRFELGGEFQQLTAARAYAHPAKAIFSADEPLLKRCAALDERIGTVAKTVKALESLAAGEHWDLFLERYLAFEKYQSSFPELVALREVALEESARQHSERSRRLTGRKQHGVAIQEVALAYSRDPANSQIARLLEQEKIANSLDEARRNAPGRKTLAPDSSEDRRFKRALFTAEQAIKDREFPKAEQALREAAAENSQAPEILLVQAQLAAALDRHAQAIPLLDNYDKLVPDLAAREHGSAIRNQIIYDLEKKKKSLRAEMNTLADAGEFSKLAQMSRAALQLDPDDEDFLFLSATSSAVLRRQEEARTLLKQYLVRSNSLRGDLKQRQRALQLLAVVERQPRPGPATLPAYSPVSAAFQPSIESVAGYKMRMDYQYQGNRLLAIASHFDDDKGLRNYRALNESRQDAESPGNFFFDYRGVSLDTVSTRKPGAAPPPIDIRVARRTEGFYVADAQGKPRMLLDSDPDVDLAVVTALKGSVATTAAGNSFFNPFVWDGVHLFSLEYDTFGRLSVAREWDADNVVRFAWSGEKLTEVSAWRKGSGSPYYVRTITYNGPRIAAETYKSGTKSGQIQYQWSTGGLLQARMEDGGVHDGKAWTVKFRQ